MSLPVNIPVPVKNDMQPIGSSYEPGLSCERQKTAEVQTWCGEVEQGAVWEGTEGGARGEG